MGTRANLLWPAYIAAACGLTACGSGSTAGSGASGGGAGPSAANLTGNLALLSHSPAHLEVQVAVADPIVASFDGPVVPECLADPDTGLWTTAGTRVDGTFETLEGGRSVRFTPAAPLAEATDYAFRFAPLTCDTSGRILELTETVEFRTLDSVPPTWTTASVASGASGVHRSAPITAWFDEALDPQSGSASTVYIKDVYGTVHPIDIEIDGSALHVTPAADLAGDREYVLAIRGGLSGSPADRAGNALVDNVSLRFRTQADTTAPQVVATWPLISSGPMSPTVAPALTFSESIDPFSVEPSSVAFLDEFGNLVPYTSEASRDRRTLRLRPTAPLVAGRGYRIALITGAAGLTDGTGNPMQGSPVVMTWQCGSDSTAPLMVRSDPAADAESVSLTATLTVDLSEGMDGSRVNTDTVALRDHALQAVPFSVVTQHLDQTILVVPTYDLDPGERYTLTLLGGDDGLRDKAGNPLAASLELNFRATLDTTNPTALLHPADGSTSIPSEAIVSAVFDSPLEPASVDSTTVTVTDDQGLPIPGQLSLVRANRVVIFTPSSPWATGTTYNATFRGGQDGLREVTGNTMRRDAATSFRTAFASDTVVPTVTLAINAVAADRQAGIVLPPSGFTLDVKVLDNALHREDLGDVDLVLRRGTAGSAAAPIGPSQDAIYETLRIERYRASWTVPPQFALAPGKYTVQAIGHDLSGNTGYSTPLEFEVVPADNRLLPFERTQVVWVRTDLDRDGTGVSDFDEDLLRLGLMAAGDPAGTNDRMRQIMRDAIIGHANTLFGRAPSGAPLSADSTPLRLTWREPLGVSHMQMGLGGFDPDGPNNRTYGAESTGVLGRALYDYRNNTPNERNISAGPGLGIFPAEMFLYQVRLHQQVYPGFRTRFAQKFLNLAPGMGGTPAGTHSLDAVVLAPNFDYQSASTIEKGRFDQVFEAADEWATSTGIILAHEIGHSVGLVAPGDNFAGGLHGDSSLHNQMSRIGEVMASAVGYDAMVTVDYGFRDLNAAYLRQRLILR